MKGFIPRLVIALLFRPEKLVKEGRLSHFEYLLCQGLKNSISYH